jgi:pimeloyl-ACP methyl ester carboxylesterase
LAESLERWLKAEGLTSADLVGSSLGARLVLEMSRRGQSGAVVALDPGGFWEGWERHFIKSSLAASVVLLRSIRPVLPVMAHNPFARSMLLAQLCARPWELNGNLVEVELQSFADTPNFDALVDDLAYGPKQEGPAAPGSGSITIGWGRHDRLCFPAQAFRAQDAFPGSRVVWFERSGHFPMWEEPEETVRIIKQGIA